MIDFGSTYTKVAVVDLDEENVVGWSQAVSTVDKDIIIGLRQALSELKVKGKPIEQLRIEEKLASSSAAGGLRLVSIGLVPSLTVEAATRAALGAGAKVVGTYSYELNDSDVKIIEEKGCDIILLAGGTDGGDKNTILHNGNMLSRINSNIPIIVAGNRVASDEIRNILRAADKNVEVTENVLPALDDINVEPARSLIRETFMRRIIEAKGIDKARQYVSNILMPTPMAVLKAVSLLADGTDEEEGLGELILVDVGGATTDVYSIAKGLPAQSDVFAKGLPEPYAKRTVEGDLGIRYNAERILEIVGEKALKENLSFVGLDPASLDLGRKIENLSHNIGFTPEKEEGLLLDTGLAYTATKLAMERHAGVIRQVELPSGQLKLQYGKDLTNIKTLIGTGGVFMHNPYPERILKAAFFDKQNPFLLKPMAADLYIDESYILYGAGLLAEIAPTSALRIAKESLRKL